MTADRAKALTFERSLACFGMVGRSLSHDLANVLATIQESAGLLDDYAAASEQGMALDGQKLRRITERIARQTERGEAYVRQLSRFAHTMDNPRETMDVRDCVDAAVGLCERFARLRKVSLTRDFPEARPQLEGSPFELQHAVFRAIELCLVATPPGGTIAVSYEARDGGTRIEVHGSEPTEQQVDLAGMAGVVALLAGQLGGDLEGQVDPGRPPRAVLTLPRRLDSLWA